MKIAFICSANICRSFMAQEFMKKYLPNAEVFSRGLYVDPTLRVPDKVIGFLQSCGIVPSPHRPTQLSADDLAQADIIFCMEPGHIAKLTDRYAQYTDKIWLLTDFAFGQEEPLTDPFSLAGGTFTRQARRLQEAVRAAAQKLIGEKGSP